MASIRVVATSTILPATYTPPNSTPQRIDFTPWDLQMLLYGSIQKGILFHQSAPNHLHSLKISLSRTLDYFYPVAGRLRFDENANKNAKLYYIECNNEGVEFVEAVAEHVTVADILDSEYDIGVVYKLFPNSGLLNIECDVNPFLAVQVTELAGGGCFIGCTMSHMVADGSSFAHFMMSWSEICRGSDRISYLPMLDRLYPHQSKLWIPNASIIMKKPDNDLTRILKEKVFHLPKEKIASLKRRAIEESGNQKISSLQVVFAHVWRAVSKSQGLDEINDVHFSLTIGHRGRTESAPPILYFGNALHLATCRLKCAEILAEDNLGRVACAINKLVSVQTEPSVVMDFIHSWIETPTFLDMDALFNDNSMMISSASKFDVYGIDFGWGRPLTIRSGSGNKGAGKVTLYEGPNDGSIDVEICLLAENLEVLKRDTEFVRGGW